MLQQDIYVRTASVAAPFDFPWRMSRRFSPRPLQWLEVLHQAGPQYRALRSMLRTGPVFIHPGTAGVKPAQLPNNTSLDGTQIANPASLPPPHHLAPMLDTVSFQIARPLKADLLAALDVSGCAELENGWVCSTDVQPGYDGVVRKRLKFFHKSYEIMATALDGIITRVTANLPHVLHGYNGLQLKPAEIAMALGRLDEILDQISDPPKFSRRFTRLDLCLNIPGDPKKLLALHRNATHPQVRRPTQNYSNPRTDDHDMLDINTVRMAGKGLVVSLYDKIAKLNKERRSRRASRHLFLRVEFQIKTAGKIEELFEWPDQQPGSLDFQECYRVFRMLLLAFKPKESKAPACTFVPLLALCANNQLALPDGRSVLDRYRSAVAPDT